MHQFQAFTWQMCRYHEQSVPKHSLGEVGEELDHDAIIQVLHDGLQVIRLQSRGQRLELVDLHFEGALGSQEAVNKGGVGAVRGP